MTALNKSEEQTGYESSKKAIFLAKNKKEGHIQPSFSNLLLNLEILLSFDYKYINCSINQPNPWSSMHQ